MEILMKLKCSPSATAARSPHSTIKVVDHHHQLQQQHIVGQPSHISGNSSSHAQQGLAMSLPASAQSNSSTTEMLLPPCLEYATSMDFCSASQQQNLIELDWEHTNSSVNGNGRNHSLQISSRDMCTGYTPPLSSITPNVYSANMHQTRPMHFPSCCSTYEPVCCGNGLTYGPSFFMPPSTLQQYQQQQMHEGSLSALNESDLGNTFAYQEPDENFVSIDDAKIKGFLMKIGEKEREKRDQAPVVPNKSRNVESVVYEIIELEDEAIESQICEKLTTYVGKPPELPNADYEFRKQNTKCKEKIVASIELLDSTDSEQDEDLVDLPLDAVTCELQCDEDDNSEARKMNFRVNDDVVLQFDDEDNAEFIDEQEEGVEVRWDDLEEQRERSFFECYLCGKKVQSSYNLRRHMMIHTGERPFGCDMCDRRFREFSDLKKHRRRHLNEPNFVCMICRINTPTEHDPTRCIACDTKNGAALAAMRPQVSSSPEKSKTPPVVLKIAKKVSTPQPPILTVTPIQCSSMKSSSTPTRSVSPVLPPLTPISVNSSSASDTQTLLDNVPAVHRSTFNQEGVLTRKEFPCPLCQRPFGTRHNLKRHFMIHTGEKPFNCPRCRKPFREYSTLKKHLVTHQRDRWYKCHLCPHKYRDYLKYTDHKKSHSQVETVHSPSKNMKKYKQALNDDSFDSNDEDSSVDDWLECCECGQRFTDIEAYTEHLKEHDPTIFLYECYICKKTFSEREDLVNHVVEHDESEKQNIDRSMINDVNICDIKKSDNKQHEI